MDVFVSAKLNTIITRRQMQMQSTQAINDTLFDKEI